MNTADVFEPDDEILTCNSKGTMVFVWRIDKDGMLRLLTPLADAGSSAREDR
jgi:hypothetical protein